jgi:hypothetical protein
MLGLQAWYPNCGSLEAEYVKFKDIGRSKKQGLSDFLHFSCLSFLFLLGKKNCRFLIPPNKELYGGHTKEF